MDHLDSDRPCSCLCVKYMVEFYEESIKGVGIYEGKYVDEVMTVDDNDAIRTAVEFAEKESVLIGISSGAAVYAAIEIAKTIGAGKKVLAIAPDGGEKYISMGIYG